MQNRRRIEHLAPRDPKRIRFDALRLSVRRVTRLRVIQQVQFAGDAQDPSRATAFPTSRRPGCRQPERLRLLSAAASHAAMLNASCWVAACLEKRVDRGFRDEIALPVDGAHGKLAWQPFRRGQGKIDGLRPHCTGDAVPDTIGLGADQHIAREWLHVHASHGPGLATKAAPTARTVRICGAPPIRSRGTSARSQRGHRSRMVRPPC